MTKVPKDFHIVDMTVRILVSNQFGGDRAKEMLKDHLNIPAVLEVEFEDTMTWEKGMHPLQKG